MCNIKIALLRKIIPSTILYLMLFNSPTFSLPHFHKIYNFPNQLQIITINHFFYSLDYSLLKLALNLTEPLILTNLDQNFILL